MTHLPHPLAEKKTADDAKPPMAVARSPGMVILYPESNKHLHSQLCSCCAYV
jgi:hypothetical protein